MAKTFGFKLRPPEGCEATWHALLYTEPTCFDLQICDRFVSRLPGFERGRNSFWMHVQEVGPEEQHEVCLWRYGNVRPGYEPLAVREQEEGPEYVLDVKTQPPFETFFAHRSGNIFADKCFPSQDKVFLRITLSRDEH